MTILGLDYGDRRLGVAVGTDSLIVTPLTPLRSANWEQLAGELVKIVNSYNVTKVVIGKSPLAEKFSRFLASRLKQPVILVDERNTSLEALEQAVELGVPQRSRGHLDSLAAAIIVKRYLLESEVTVV